MKFDSKFNIKIEPDYSGRNDREVDSSYGKITIGNFYEYFYMSPNWWTINDYEKQWKLALERINHETTTCFITNVQATPLVEMWVFYREDKTIYIQNYIFVEKEYKKLFGGKSLTPETSFDFIPIREIMTQDGIPISEWSLKIVD